MNGLPLESIRVLEFGTGYVGPVLCKNLADFGAQVIKVESRRRLDFQRGADPARIEQGISFADCNRNKLGITVDATHPHGLEIVTRLLRLCDVVVENLSGGAMKRMGLDYPQVRQVRPDAIMISMQGLGATESHSVTFGQNLPPLVGLTHLWNHPGTVPPVGSQLFHPDYFAGVLCTSAVLAALDYRARTGCGQYIDASQAECAAWLLGPHYLEYAVNGRVPEPRGNRNLGAAPQGCYRCAGEDRWCVIAVDSDQEWEAFRRALGEPSWAQDPRFATLLGRLEHQDALDAHIEAWTQGHSPQEVMEILQRAGVAAAAVQDARDVSQDPHLQARGFLVEIPHPVMGRVLHGGIPMSLSETPGVIRSAAPLLGEHNEYVLGELLGYSAREIAALAEAGALY